MMGRDEGNAEVVVMQQMKVGIGKIIYQSDRWRTEDAIRNLDHFERERTIPITNQTWGIKVQQLFMLKKYL